MKRLKPKRYVFVNGAYVLLPDKPKLGPVNPKWINMPKCKKKKKR